jgi:beta-lactamase class D
MLYDHYETRATKRTTKATTFVKDMKLARLFFILFLLGCSGSGARTNSAATAAPTPDLSPFFKDTVGCIVVYDLKENRYTRYNEARCRERFNPKSTFKIPNSLIGLETGVLKDADFLIPWDKQKYPPDNWDTEPFVNWKRDHTLRTAFKHSVLWYYREIALRAGPERMKHFVSAFDYGNKDTSGAVDRFWLNNTLLISADEQVEFLKKLYADKLPVSKGNAEIVKEITVQERNPAYTLRAKTGGGARAEGVAIGWYVGYVETKGNVYFFAFNMDGTSYLAIRDRRIELTRQILEKLDVIPKA